MSDLNKVMLIGRLGQKPELKQLSNGEAMTRLNVATSKSFARNGVREESTEWHSVAVFGKQAETCVRYLDKGRLVYVEGALRSRQWKGKDGAERQDREIRAENVTFLNQPPHAQAA